MTSIPENLVKMISQVARALGSEMLSEIAFVGGCTTGLLMTDDITKESIRFTQDVDLIIDIISHSQWHSLQEKLREIGFRDPKDEGDPICRMILGELKVDFMPIEAKILGFSNRWYREALETAQPFKINDDLTIRLLTPPLFIATKLEAYQGRGKNDPIGSNDVEDILNLFDGREELVTEIKAARIEIQKYIATQIGALLEHEMLPYAISSQTRNSPGRDELIYERLEKVRKI